MPDLGISGWDLKATLSYLKSTPSHLSNCKISLKKQECLNLGPKMPYLGVFDQKRLFGHPQICLIAKFCKQKQKYLNLGPEMPYLAIFGLEL